MNEESNPETAAITVKDAAAKLSVSPRTIWRMIADGQLRAVRFRRCTRVLANDVAKFLGNSVQARCV